MADTLRSAEEMADDVLHSPVPRAPELIHADRIATARRVLEKVAERCRSGRGVTPHKHMQALYEIAYDMEGWAADPTALEALLKETK